jgi:hypothetical protein
MSLKDITPTGDIVYSLFHFSDDQNWDYDRIEQTLDKEGMDVVWIHDRCMIPCRGEDGHILSCNIDEIEFLVKHQSNFDQTIICRGRESIAEIHAIKFNEHICSADEVDLLQRPMKYYTAQDKQQRKVLFIEQ